MFFGSENRAAYRAGWRAAYHKYLKTKRWKTLRLLVLSRDNSECQICGKAANTVHHLTYDRIFDEDSNDLVSLCNACHTNIDYRT